MKIKWVKKGNENIDLKIDEITLLSKEEYIKLKDVIPIFRGCWWLRSPGDRGDVAAFVYGEYGSVFEAGCRVTEVFGVRPALQIKNLSSLNLKIGDKASLFGRQWTVISDSLVLCDAVIGETCFRKDDSAPDANDYEHSDIKQWLENWAAARGKTSIYDDVIKIQEIIWRNDDADILFEEDLFELQDLVAKLALKLAAVEGKVDELVKKFPWLYEMK